MGRSEAGLYLFVSRSSAMSGNCDLNRGAVTALNPSRGLWGCHRCGGRNTRRRASQSLTARLALVCALAWRSVPSAAMASAQLGSMTL